MNPMDALREQLVQSSVRILRRTERLIEIQRQSGRLFTDDEVEEVIQMSCKGSFAQIAELKALKKLEEIEKYLNDRDAIGHTMIDQTSLNPQLVPLLPVTEKIPLFAGVPSTSTDTLRRRKNTKVPDSDPSAEEGDMTLVQKETISFDRFMMDILKQWNYDKLYLDRFSAAMDDKRLEEFYSNSSVIKFWENVTVVLVSALFSRSPTMAIAKMVYTFFNVLGRETFRNINRNSENNWYETVWLTITSVLNTNFQSEVFMRRYMSTYLSITVLDMTQDKNLEDIVSTLGDKMWERLKFQVILHIGAYLGAAGGKMAENWFAGPIGDAAGAMGGSFAALFDKMSFEGIYKWINGAFGLFDIFIASVKGVIKHQQKVYDLSPEIVDIFVRVVGILASLSAALKFHIFGFEKNPEDSSDESATSLVILERMINVFRFVVQFMMTVLMIEENNALAMAHPSLGQQDTIMRVWNQANDQQNNNDKIMLGIEQREQSKKAEREKGVLAKGYDAALGLVTKKEADTVQPTPPATAKEIKPLNSLQKTILSCVEGKDGKFIGWKMRAMMKVTGTTPDAEDTQAGTSWWDALKSSFNTYYPALALELMTMKAEGIGLCIQLLLKLAEDTSIIPRKHKKYVYIGIAGCAYVIERYNSAPMQGSQANGMQLESGNPIRDQWKFGFDASTLGVGSLVMSVITSAIYGLPQCSCQYRPQKAFLPKCLGFKLNYNQVACSLGVKTTDTTHYICKTCVQNILADINVERRVKSGNKMFLTNQKGKVGVITARCKIAPDTRFYSVPDKSEHQTRQEYIQMLIKSVHETEEDAKNLLSKLKADIRPVVIKYWENDYLLYYPSAFISLCFDPVTLTLFFNIEKILSSDEYDQTLLSQRLRRIEPRYEFGVFGIVYYWGTLFEAINPTLEWEVTYTKPDIIEEEYEEKDKMLYRMLRDLVDQINKGDVEKDRSGQYSADAKGKTKNGFYTWLKRMQVQTLVYHVLRNGWLDKKTVMECVKKQGVRA